MNEDQTQSVANVTETQTKDAAGSTKIPDKAEQQNVANSKNAENQNVPGQNVKENTADETPQEKTADTTQPAQPKDGAVKSTNPPDKDDQSLAPTDTPTDKSQTTDQKKSAADNPAKNSDNSTAEPSKKLSDVVPSTIVWISGMVGKKQIDCAGPFEAPFKIDKPTWPYVNVSPNPNYTNQLFDYDKSEWVPTDAKSQGQMLTDLVKQVTTLKDDSQKHDQSADQSQKMGIQLTKVMLQLSSKVDALNTKIDGIVNDKKDGDK